MQDRSETPWNSYWRAVSHSWERHVRRSTKSAPSLLTIMQQQGFPRLLRLIRDMFSRLSTQISVGILSADSFEQREFLRAFQSFENAFLSRSLSRLTDPVNHALTIIQSTSRGGAGSLTMATTKSHSPPAYLQPVAKAIRVELEMAKSDSRLLRQIVKNIAKSLQMYAVKCETLVSACVRVCVCVLVDD